MGFLDEKDISVFPISVRGSAESYKVVNNINYALVGDSILNVHFFSGTGINSGFKIAEKLSEAYSSNNLAGYNAEVQQILSSSLPSSRSIASAVRTRPVLPGGRQFRSRVRNPQKNETSRITLPGGRQFRQRRN